MSGSVTSCGRAAMLLAALSGVTAIAVGRLAPIPAHYRLRIASQLVAVNSYQLSNQGRASRLLDPETGRLRPIDIPGGDTLDYVSCSPWIDEQGGTVAVGRWTARSSPDRTCRAVGLARFTIPGGLLIDRVDTAVIPTSRPCWSPSAPARVVYAAADGLLYAHTFDDTAGPRAFESPNGAAPRPLAWRTAPPGDGEVFIQDPAWPMAPGFEDVLLASISLKLQVEGHPAYGPSRLWWLRLSPDGTGIVAAGPLFAPGAIDPELNQSLPSLVGARDGAFSLGYLTSRPKRRGWTLRLARARLDPETGNPRVDVVLPALADRCAAAPPAFSADGRWVCAIRNPEYASFHVERFPIDGADAPRPLSLALIHHDRPRR